MTEETMHLSALGSAETGRLSWAEAREMLENMRWYWAGQDGAHYGDPLPGEPPIATHLWGWGENQWARLRLDHGKVVGAILSREAHDGSLPLAVTGWTEHNAEVPPEGNAPGTPKPRSRPATLWQTRGEHPLTFVAFT